MHKLNRALYSEEALENKLEDMADKPPYKKIFIIVLICFFFVFLVIAIAYATTWKVAELLEDEADTGMGNKARTEYLNTENHILESYGETKSLKAYRIPIDIAMKKLVDNQISDVSSLATRLGALETDKHELKAGSDASASKISQEKSPGTSVSKTSQEKSSGAKASKTTLKEK